MPFSTLRSSAPALAAVQRRAVALGASAAEDDGLVELLANARFAPIGEASHGSDDFYRERANDELAKTLAAPRLQRAIGVIYRPERHSHYFQTRLPRQFDAMLHLDATLALEPLDRRATPAEADAPETYPSGV